MSQPMYLGRPAYEPKPHSRLDPIAAVNEGAWYVYREWTNALPTEGRAFAPRLPGLSVRCLVAFSVEPNTVGEKDQFIVANPTPVSEVLDYRLAGVEIARRQLVEDGLLDLLYGSQSVVVALPNQLCVEVPLSRHPSTGAWVAKIDGLDHLQTYVLDERLFDGDQIEGRWLAVPDLTVGAPAGQVNWCRDADFLESVLKRLRKSTQQGSGSLSRSQIQQIVGQLDRSGLLPAAGADLESYRSRLQNFSQALTANLGAVDDIVTTLSTQPSVEQALEAYVAERKGALERELRTTLEDAYLQDLHASFAGLNEDRDRLAAEVDDLKSNLEAQRSQLNQERLELVDARGALSTDLRTLLSEFDDVPLLEDKDIAALGGLLAKRLGDAGESFTVALAGAPPWSAPRGKGAQSRPWSDLDDVLGRSARRWNYSAEDLRLADVAVRSGAIVVLPEGLAGDFVTCYAEAVAGGEVSRHVLDPSVISVDDLWRLPGSGRFGAFAKAWSRAKLDPKRLQILLLDGLHRTPSSLWMPTLLDVIQDARRPPNLLVFVAVGSPPVDPERAWPIGGGAVTVLSPSIGSGTSAAVLANIARSDWSVTVFDASDAPEPTLASMMSAITELEDVVSAERLRMACEQFRAAWAFGPEQAMQLARTLNGVGQVQSAGLSAGNAWVMSQTPHRDQ